MDKILERELDRLTYVDPEELARVIEPMFLGILHKSEAISHLSSKEKNDCQEIYQAALIASLYKYSSRLRATVTVCVTAHLKRFKDEDFDCVIKAEMGTGKIVRKRVQLKQLASHEKAKNLQEIIEKLKFPKLSDLVVAIWINRDTDLKFECIDFNGLNIEQLWFFGESVSGEITLNGGFVSGLRSGLHLSAIMKKGITTGEQVRFKPQLPKVKLVS